MGKMSIEEIIEVVENDDLGYAIQSLIDYDDIEDKHLAYLWKQARDVLSDIKAYLQASDPDCWI